MFAAFRELTGKSECLVASSTCLTIGQLKVQLAHDYPALKGRRVLMARNQTLGRDDEIVRPTDELACFPPVSGG